MSSDHTNEIRQAAKKLGSFRNILSAPGDEPLQHLIPKMMKTEDCGGVRVGTSQKKQICPVGGVPPHSAPEKGGHFENVPDGNTTTVLTQMSKQLTA